MYQTKHSLVKRSWVVRLVKQIGTERLVLIALVVTLFAILLLVALYRAILTLVGAPLGPESWPLDGVMSLITLALFMGGGLFAFAEYIEAEEDRHKEAAQASFTLYDSLVNRLMNPEEIEIRRWIIQNIPQMQEGDDYGEWIEHVRQILFPDGYSGQTPGHRNVKAVLNTFDYLGFVALNYWDLDGPLMDWMMPMITKVWDRIGPYVEEEAHRRDEPDYYKWARQFGHRCIEWRRSKNLPPPKIVKNAL